MLLLRRRSKVYMLSDQITDLFCVCAHTSRFLLLHASVCKVVQYFNYLMSVKCLFSSSLFRHQSKINCNLYKIVLVLLVFSHNFENVFCVLFLRRCCFYLYIYKFCLCISQKSIVNVRLKFVLIR